MELSGSSHAPLPPAFRGSRPSSSQAETPPPTPTSASTPPSPPSAYSWGASSCLDFLSLSSYLPIFLLLSVFFLLRFIAANILLFRYFATVTTFPVVCSFCGTDSVYLVEHLLFWRTSHFTSWLIAPFSFFGSFPSVWSQASVQWICSVILRKKGKGKKRSEVFGDHWCTKLNREASYTQGAHPVERSPRIKKLLLNKACHARICLWFGHLLILLDVLSLNARGPPLRGRRRKDHQDDRRSLRHARDGSASVVHAAAAGRPPHLRAVAVARRQPPRYVSPLRRLPRQPALPVAVGEGRPSPVFCYIPCFHYSVAVDVFFLFLYVSYSNVFV